MGAWSATYIYQITYLGAYSSTIHPPAEHSYITYHPSKYLTFPLFK